jgi:hypothetical protein
MDVVVFLVYRIESDLEMYGLKASRRIYAGIYIYPGKCP